MFMAVFHAPGLAHRSYVVGDGNAAAVIDPSRDCQCYMDAAYEKGARITHIFETHRNEDYVIGSLELARRTGAEAYHGGELDFAYGHPVEDGQAFELGDLRIVALHTPGHTLESKSYVLYDTSFGDLPLGVFTGDVLFVGDVGRTDFFPDRAEEVSGMLYDSIFDKLLPLGDQVILYPAHGAGSVCGAGIAERDFSTLGYERRTNPRLQMMDRGEFVRFKVGEHHYTPPYFSKMEEYNLAGAPPLDELPRPCPLPPDHFERDIENGMVVADVRSPEAFGGAHIPGSYCLPLEVLSAFAGWVLPYDRPIGLVVDDVEQVEPAVRHLIRVGYDDLSAYLAGGLHAWEASGRQFERVPGVHISEVGRRIKAGEQFRLIDVRKRDELEEGMLKGAQHIYVGDLSERADEIAGDGAVTVYCNSGVRAMIAASILQRKGVKNVEDTLGSMEACEATGCDVIRSAPQQSSEG